MSVRQGTNSQLLSKLQTMNEITAVHPGKSGDIVLAMAVLRRVFDKYQLRTRLTIAPNPDYDDYNAAKALSLATLLAHQTCIAAVSVDQDKPKMEYRANKVLDTRKFDVDFRRWSEQFREDRGQLNIVKDLCDWMNRIYPAWAVDPGNLAAPWMTFLGEDALVKTETVYVNRTNRDTTPDEVWRRVLNRHRNLAFLGTQIEHAEFEARVAPIRFEVATDALELSKRILSGAKLVASQSLPMALSSAFGTPLYGMVTREFHDCVFIRGNAEYNCFGMPFDSEYQVGV